MKKFKKLCSVVICVLLTVCLFVGIMPTVSAAAGDNVYYESENNNYFSTADVIFNGYHVFGQLSQYDLDYFKFTITKKSLIEISIVSTYNHLMFGICDSNDNVVAVASYFKYINGTYAYLCDTVLEAGTYYIGVFNDTKYKITETTSYLFEFKYTPYEELATWQLDSNGWWYSYADGSYAVGWAVIDGAWYYFNQSGYMMTGWQWIGNAWYYFNAGGDMVSNAWVGGYYLSASGAMTTPSWQLDGNGWWYSYGDGTYATGWAVINGSWYYFNASGYMVTGWLNLGGTWYYMSDSGAMVTDWQLIGGTWYYFYSDGSMAANTWIGNYWLSPSGAMA